MRFFPHPLHFYCQDSWCRDAECLLSYVACCCVIMPFFLFSPTWKCLIKYFCRFSFFPLVLDDLLFFLLPSHKSSQVLTHCLGLSQRPVPTLFASDLFTLVASSLPCSSLSVFYLPFYPSHFPIIEILFLPDLLLCRRFALLFALRLVLFFVTSHLCLLKSPAVCCCFSFFSFSVPRTARPVP